VGVGRNLGYIISVGLFIIPGLIGAVFTYGLSLLWTILGFVFIHSLRNAARQERIEKHLRHLDPYDRAQRNLEDIDRLNEKRKGIYDKKTGITYYKD